MRTNIKIEDHKAIIEFPILSLGVLLDAVHEGRDALEEDFSEEYSEEIEDLKSLESELDRIVFRGE